MSLNFEAFLIHSMGTEDDKDEPHLRGKSLIWAGVYLAYLAQTENPRILPNLVFTGRQYWGEKERPAVGLVAAKAAIKELDSAKIPAVVSYVPDWVDKKGNKHPIVETSGEIQGFLQFAQQHHFTRVASVSSQTHLDTIDQLYKRHTAGTQIKGNTISAEGTLFQIPGEVGHAFYVDKISEILNGQDEREFRQRELIKWFAYLLPSGEKILRHQAEKGRAVSQQIRSNYSVLAGK